MGKVAARRHFITSVEAAVFPFDYWHDWYQKYYRQSIEIYLAQYGTRVQYTASPLAASILRQLASIRDSYRLRRVLGPLAPMSTSLVTEIAKRVGGDKRPIASLVGEYFFSLEDGKRISMCVDSHDSGDVNSQELALGSDVYLKTNYWPTIHYADSVIPFFNCNPLLVDNLKTLRLLRGQRQEFDISCIVRVWGGKNEVEGNEHCLRLLEAVAKARAEKYLLAFLVGGDIKEMSSRLRQSGIPFTTEPIPRRKLWEITARSKLTIIRLGMHHCVPWRMSDVLALGACTVLDQPPKTVWPVPLVEGTHFFSLDVETTTAQSVASDAQYELIPEVLGSFLTKDEHLSEMSRAAVKYFEDCLDPKSVGQRMCESVQRFARLKADVL
jgi:hypothetical protein